MAVTEYGQAQWAAVQFGLAALPANFYIALLTAEPGDGWDGTVLQTVEPVDVGVYLRQALAVPTDWSLTDAGYVINSVALAYATPTVDWGEITHFGLTDDGVAGELWAYNWFLEPLFVPAGLAPGIDIGSIYHTLGNQLETIAES